MQTRTSSNSSPRPALRLAALTLALTAGCGDAPAGADDSASAATSTGGEPVTATEVDPTGGPTSTGDGGSTVADGSTTAGGSSSGDAPVTTGGTDDTGSTGAADSTGTGDASSTGDTEGALETFVKVQVVALNDFHGNIEPPQGSSGKIWLPDDTSVDAGGAAFLAAHVAALRADNPNTVVVSAGDLIGASPLISALFHDEPTVEVMNLIGLDYNAVGNHEFDDGFKELLRMQTGDCHPVDGCLDGTPYLGASFQFLAANVLVAEEPLETLFPSYAVREVDGARIAFIGMTLADTPEIVTPEGIVGLTFLDEVERANALVPELTAMGVRAIVVLIHEGGFQAGFHDECDGISGPIVDIATGLSDEIDVVISGHTHQAYNCEIAGKVVTSAASFGRVLTDIDLEISSKTGDVTAVSAANVLVTRDAADPDIAAYVAKYKALVAPLADKPVGEITATLERYPPGMKPGLSTMGLVLADAHLAATADMMLGGAQIAFMNPGGVRADLLYAKGANEPKDGMVSYGEAFAVQPFGNSLVVMTLTGAQIEQVLEQQFTDKYTNVLQVSAGFTYAYSQSAPLGAKVDAASIELDGVAVSPLESYRVAVIGYLASGGDGFSVLLAGTDRLGGVTDLQALEEYFVEHSPVSPPALDRVTVLP